jgi:hypothetical protein
MEMFLVPANYNQMPYHKPFMAEQENNGPVTKCPQQANGKTLSSNSM